MIQPEAIRRETGPATLEAIRTLHQRTRLVERDASITQFIFQAGGASGQVKYGTEKPQDLNPQDNLGMYIHIDIPNSLCNIYVAAPTATDLSAWTWVYINGVSLT